MAFILAGIVVFVTLAYAGLIVGAAMISDAPTRADPFPPLIIGLTLAGLLVASHYIHLGW